jgi:hypothetical protein
LCLEREDDIEIRGGDKDEEDELMSDLMDDDDAGLFEDEEEGEVRPSKRAKK